MGAQIDEAGHQHRARRDIGAAPHDRAGNGAKVRLPEIGLAPALELRRHLVPPMGGEARPACDEPHVVEPEGKQHRLFEPLVDRPPVAQKGRSEEHTSELQSLMRISYAVFCLKKKNKKRTPTQATDEPMQQTTTVLNTTQSTNN